MSERVLHRPATLLSPLLLVLSLLPYWAIPVAHMASAPTTATGFFHQELPYYMANGRAAFERGNGLAYPNPYDPDAAAPTIYAHWLLWFLGLCPAVLGTDPGDLMLVATLLASLGFAGTTWQLVAQRARPDTSLSGPFLLAMWGGGLLAAGGCLAGWLGFVDPQSTVLQFDPGRGLWFLNWGRNALFATEAVYHILAAACWLCEMQGRRLAGTVCCLLLATTHPWSGLELLLTVNLWRLWQWLQHRDPASLRYALVAGLMLTCFLGYYQVWLPRHAHHQRLQQVWELDWSLSWTSAALAYAVVLIPAAARLGAAVCGAAVRGAAARSAADPAARSAAGTGLCGPPQADGQTARFAGDGTAAAAEPAATPCVTSPVAGGPLEQAEQFLVCAAVVAAGLIFHDRYLQPIQPLHFTRGYLWMPLFLLGLPVLQTWWHRAARGRLVLRLGLAAAALLLLTDNLAFTVLHCRWQWQHTDGFHLSPHDRAMLAELHAHFPGQVTLTESETLNYLTPAYANCRPWLGHMFNTPDFHRRQAVAASLFAGPSVPLDRIPPDVDVLVLRRSRDAAALQASGRWVWLESHNAEWAFWVQLRGQLTESAPGAARASRVAGRP